MSRKPLTALGLLVLLLPAGSAAAGASLRFERSGETVAQLSKGEIDAGCRVREVRVPYDPYEGGARSYRACPLRLVLELGLGGIPEDFATTTVLLRAEDGYARPVPGAALLAPEGFLALSDAGPDEAGPSGFEPLAGLQVDPGPFYIVWTDRARSDPQVHPWVYQLIALELVVFEERFPHTVPRGAPEGSAVRRGYAIFRRDCIACHAVNGEGGSVGPDLNIPRSIVEYRPEEQIKAYVRDPGAFRYTSMPAHPGLDAQDLDALIHYFRFMRAHKHDPHRKGAVDPSS